MCLSLFKIILSQYIKIFYANLCKFSNLLACVLLTTCQPFLGLMLFPNISATDTLRDNEAKTRLLTLLVVASKLTQQDGGEKRTEKRFRCDKHDRAITRMLVVMFTKHYSGLVLGN